MSTIEFIRKHSQKILLLIITCMCTCIFGAGSCIDSRIIKALDDAIEALDVNSAEWQNIMQQLIEELEAMGDLAEDILNEVDNIYARGVAITTTEFRCNYDFIGDRMREALIRLKKQNFDTDDPVPLLVPHVCQAVPSFVDPMEPPPLVEYFGYDFDLPCTKLYAEKLDGTRIDKTHALDMVSHYHMTINSSSIDFESLYVRLVLTCDSEVISSIPCLWDSTAEIELHPAIITHTPLSHTNGDKEFYGAPHIECSAKLDTSPDDTELGVTIWMKAQEQKGDWTTVEGSLYEDLYWAPEGKQIKQILSNTYDSIHTDECDCCDPKEFVRDSYGLVNKYIILGDTYGDDIGKTNVEVWFNDVVFLIGYSGAELGNYYGYELVVLEPEEDGFVCHTYELDQEEVAGMVEGSN